jgi:hypothetical protein
MGEGFRRIKSGRIVDFFKSPDGGAINKGNGF